MDDRSLGYTADPAGGIAGLYDVTVSDEGRVIGSSETGGQLEGQLGYGPQDSRYTIAGTITSPDGETRDFEASAAVQAPVEGASSSWPKTRLGEGRSGPARDLPT